MASTYSTILRLTYPTTGDLAGTWGTIVNTGVTALVEDALAGVASIAMADANYTLSANNGVSDEARKAFLQITGALTASRDIIIPAVTKAYTVTNATTGGFSVVVKPAAGTGVTIPNGSTYMVRCDGTNVVAMFTGFPYTGTQDFSGATLVTLPANTTIGNVSAAELAYLDGVTSAIQTQLNAKAPIASPTFTGTVTIPAGASIDGFAPLASPTFTGTVTIPSGASIAGFAPLASPALTGTPTAPTATAGTSTTQLATTAFAYNNFAPVASPAFTGIPTAPTASPGTSTTQLATTAFAAGLAFSAALPNQTGNAGKIVTTDGSSASWTAVKTVNNASILTTGNIDIVGTGGTTSTASITLTASSAAAMTVTPATPGLYVTLPDATTCTKADNLYSVYNAGEYDYGVKDSAGTQLGWIRARTGAMIGLADNSTAAGVWAYYGLEKTGITASYANSTLTGMTDTASNGTSSITVDADRTAFLFGGTSCYVIVYNQSTQTWGAATLVRASTQTATHTGILASADLLLVCTCNTTTDMETVTISLSDVTPTVNSGTKASTTLAGNISASGTGFGRMVAVGTSWVVPYSRATTTCGIRAITVSGTTPTVGAETALSTGAAELANLYASGSIVRTVCKSTSTNIQCKPYTVSGSTLSAGTAANVTTTAGSWFRSFVNGNGNIVVDYDNSNHSATIFKLTTTTEAASTGILSTTPPTVNPNNADYAVVSASKTAYISHANSTNWYANILTDTAGTASVGTQITYATVGNMAGLANFGVSGNNVRFGYSATTQHGQFTLDCSGASPVMSSVVAAIYTSSSTSLPTPIASDRYGELGGNQLTVGASSMVLGGNVTASDYMFAANSLKRIGSLLTTGTPGNSTLTKPRSSNSDLWLFRPVGTTSIGYSFQRIEAAA